MGWWGPFTGQMFGSRVLLDSDAQCMYRLFETTPLPPREQGEPACVCERCTVGSLESTEMLGCGFLCVLKDVEALFRAAQICLSTSLPVWCVVGGPGLESGSFTP